MTSLATEGAQRYLAPLGKSGGAGFAAFRCGPPISNVPSLRGWGGRNFGLRQCPHRQLAIPWPRRERYGKSIEGAREFTSALIQLRLEEPLHGHEMNHTLVCRCLRW